MFQFFHKLVHILQNAQYIHLAFIFIIKKKTCRSREIIYTVKINFIRCTNSIFLF